jgi:prepilin-type processing-associated H-X9-DG protein
MYVQDYDETFPFSDNFAVRIPGSPVQSGYQYWGDAIFPYTKNGGNATHPTTPGVGTGLYGPVQRCPSVADWWTGYAWNIDLGYFPGDQLSPRRTGPAYEGVKLASLTRPSDLIVILDNSVAYAFERNYGGATDARAQYYFYRWSPRGANVKQCLEFYDWPESGRRLNKAGAGVESGRHSGGVNCVFADGHSKWVKTGDDLCKRERGDPYAP